MWEFITGIEFYPAILVAVGLILCITTYGVVMHIGELYEENKWKKWEEKYWFELSQRNQK